MMSVRLAIDIGLSAVAITHAEPDGSAGCADEDNPSKANHGGPMKMIVTALAASIFLTGCISNSGSASRPPNYVTSQAYQSPGIRNDAFGGAAMPMRGLPR